MRRCIVCLGLAALSSLVLAGCEKTQAKPLDAAPDEVEVSTPIKKVVTDFEEFIGHTDAMLSVEVRARVNGYLDKVNFNDGDEVEKGAMLFEIDARPYQSTYDNQAAILEQAEARFTTATANQRRAEALLQRTAIGREEYDRIQGEFAEAKANIGAAQATLSMAKLNLDWTKVVAPISGRLSRRMVDPGNLVQADVTPLTTIVSLDPMYAYFDVDERTLLKIRRLIADGRIKSRRDAELPVYLGLSDEPGYPHKGVINFSDNRLDASTGTLRLRGQVANPPPRLFSPGLFVRVHLPVGVPHESVMIAEQAIGTDQGQKFVYVVSRKTIKDKKTGKDRTAEVVESRPIKVGLMEDGLRVVDEGLQMGERVVISGLQRVRPGKEVVARVQGEKPADPARDVPKVVSIPAEAASPASAGAAGQGSSAPSSSTH